MDELALPADFARKAAGNVQATPFSPRRALGDRVGDMLVVDGSDAPAAPVRRGARVDLALYLHAARPIPAGWRLFAHLVGPGRMLNADHEPVEGTMPLRRLRPGTFVRDRDARDAAARLAGGHDHAARSACGAAASARQGRGRARRPRQLRRRRDADGDPVRRRMTGAAEVLRAVALALAAWLTLALLYVFARRFVYPYDLEWMEGGMLDHALRLAHGQPIYAPPSVDFIPYLYTPGYPFVVFVLGKLFGIGYKLGRFVSLVGFFTVVVLGYVYARREGGSRAAAACGIAIIFAAFVPTGAFYDLARPDSLFMGLVTAGLLVAWWKRHSPAGGVAAALVFIAAFYVKQTAAPFMVALGLALLARRAAHRRRLRPDARRRRPARLVAVEPRLGRLVLDLHLGHPSQARLLRRARVPGHARPPACSSSAPRSLLVPWALVRRRTPGLVYATFIALAGIVAACVSFGTQWAFTNAFMPGVMLPAIAIGVAAGRLLDDTREAPPRLAPRRRLSPARALAS